jgi:hypothetical protein
MSLKSAMARLFGRRKAMHEELAREERRDSDKVDAAAKECASVTIGHRQAAEAFETAVSANKALHADVRSKMPTRRLLKDENDEVQTGELAAG